MTKFHISKNGVPAICTAQDNKCPLGSQHPHFDTQHEAEEYIQNESQLEFGILGELSKQNQTKQLNDKLSKVFSPNDVEILDKLSANGHRAYFVGGSLRDAAIGLPINDVDITTSATPEEVLSVFSDHPTLPIGIEHGTVIVMYKGEQIEITTFRTDGEYSDGRRPDEVNFTTNLSDDVQRRDFTINSLAYNPKEGLIDLAGGVDDVNSKLIRAVGNADDRFKEDPLRIMRGLRFASKLDFEIEKDTEEALFRNKSLLKNVSVERLQVEFNGLLMGKNSREVLIKYAPVIAEFVPEIEPMIGFEQNNPHHLYDVWEHSAVVVENAKDDPAHKLAAIFHDSGKPSVYKETVEGKGQFLGHAEESVKIAEQALTRLKYDNKTKEKVLHLIEDHDHDLSTKKYKIAKKIYEDGPERFLESLEFVRADDLGKDTSYNSRFDRISKVERIAKEYLADSPILSPRDLDIKSKDIMDLGFKGKEIGDALTHLSHMAMSGHKNERESQINYLKKHGLNQFYRSK